MSSGLSKTFAGGGVTAQATAVHAFTLWGFSPQDTLRQKEERIEELEEALRESVQITAEREVVLAQEEQARTQSEKQVLSFSVAKMHKCVTVLHA